MIGKRRISPSSAAWAVGQLIDTPYEKSCGRYMVWQRRYEKESNIDEMYSHIGGIDEARYAAKLTQGGLMFWRELPINIPVGGTQITIEGRLDFKVSESDGPIIVEKKSITSVNRRRTIIEKGEIDHAHMAQLVTYLVAEKLQRGKIVYTYWQWNEDLSGFMATEDREFAIRLDTNGSIYVDEAPFGRHIRELQTWYRLVASGMEKAETELLGRPKPLQGWQNPCRSCPLSAACDQYDSTRNVAQFWQQTAGLEPREGKPAVIQIPKLKKGKTKNGKLQASLSIGNDTDTDTGRIRDQTGGDRGEIY